MIYDIPIDFCPKCGNKKITIVQGRSIEYEYSLTGKCIKKQKCGDATYSLLKCRKCGWTSKPFGEVGFDEKEWEELAQIYLKKMENMKVKNE